MSDTDGGKKNLCYYTRDNIILIVGSILFDGLSKKLGRFRLRTLENPVSGRYGKSSYSFVFL